MPILSQHITAIILAGGKSSRMGKDKGLLVFKEKPMIAYAIDAVKEFCSEILIISNQKEYEQFGYPVHNDLIKEIGPIGGIYTGLTHSKTTLNLILTCDSPLVDKNLVKNLINEYTAELAVFYCEFKANQYPLTAIYTKKMLPKIEQSIARKNYKVRTLFEEVISNPFEISEADYKKMMNVNTPKDLSLIEK